MNKTHSNFLFYTVILFAVCYCGYQWNQSRKLDAFYLEQLQTVKHRMLFGSSVDTQEELSRYQDHIELCMHLDGYTGPEIMKIRAEAFKNSITENAGS